MNNYYKPNFTIMKTFKLLSLLLVLAVVTFSSSCKPEDDPIVIIEEGLAVADGFYITQAGADPVATNQLVAENVEDEGFGTQAREGFVANFIYLTSGSYNLVNVVGKAITETYGGSATAETHDLGNCTPLNYTLVSTAVDGAAFSVATDGLYKVTYDATTSEALLINITNVGIVGSATSIGWTDEETVDLPGTIAADGATWTASDITLRQGDFKVRLNCNWVLDRRIDPEGLLDDPTNGYQIYTNFGGTPDNFQIGNDGTPRDISVSAVGGTAPDEANYTVTVTWTPDIGFAMSLDRTGEAPILVISFVPEDHPWSIRGEIAVGSPSDWSSGPLLTPNHDGATYRWYGVIELSAGEFKIADGATWLGVGSSVTDNSGVMTGTDNFIVSEADAGFYYFTVITSDDGASYAVTIDKASFGIIGSATAGGWDIDTDMTEGGSSWTITTDLVDGDWKFRANDAWEYNLGGDLTGLTHNGGNVAATAGNYTITLITADRGATYTATVQ